MVGVGRGVLEDLEEGLGLFLDTEMGGQFVRAPLPVRLRAQGGQRPRRWISSTRPAARFPASTPGWWYALMPTSSA